MAGKSQMASLVPDALMEKARLFVRDLPDVYSLKQGWNSIIFELIDKRKMSGNKLNYKFEHIDKHALAAFRKILNDQDMVELVLNDFRFVFLVYFRRKNRITGEMLFTYSMRDKLFH